MHGKGTRVGVTRALACPQLTADAICSLQPRPPALPALPPQATPSDPLPTLTAGEHLPITEVELYQVGGCGGVWDGGNSRAPAASTARTVARVSWDRAMTRPRVRASNPCYLHPIPSGHRVGTDHGLAAPSRGTTRTPYGIPVFPPVASITLSLAPTPGTCLAFGRPG